MLSQKSGSWSAAYTLLWGMLRGMGGFAEKAPIKPFLVSFGNIATTVHSSALKFPTIWTRAHGTTRVPTTVFSLILPCEIPADGGDAETSETKRALAWHHVAGAKTTSEIVRAKVNYPLLQQGL